MSLLDTQSGLTEVGRTEGRHWSAVPDRVNGEERREGLSLSLQFLQSAIPMTQ